MADEEDDVVFVNSPLFQHLSEVGFSDFDAQCHYDQSEQGTGNIAASTHTESNSDSRNSNHCQHWQDFLQKICEFICCFVVTSTKSKERDCHTLYLSMIKESRLLTDDDAELIFRFEKSILCESVNHDISTTSHLHIDVCTERNKQTWFTSINSITIIGLVVLLAMILGYFTTDGDRLNRVLYTSIGIFLCFAACKICFLSWEINIDHRYKHNLLLLRNYLEAVKGLHVFIRKAVLFIQEKELLARGHIIISPKVPITRMESNARKTIKQCIALRKCIFTEAIDCIRILQTETNTVYKYSLQLFANSKMFNWFGEHLSGIGTEWSNIGSHVNAEENEFSLDLLKSILSYLVDQQSLLLCHICLMSLCVVAGQKMSKERGSTHGIIKDCFECLLEDVNEHSNNIKQCYKFHRMGVIPVSDEQRIKIPSGKTGSMISPFLMAVHSMNLHLQEASKKSFSIEEQLEDIDSKTSSVEEFIAEHFDEIEKELMQMKSNLDNLASCWDESHNRLHRLSQRLIKKNEGGERKASDNGFQDQSMDSVQILSITGEVDLIPDQVFEGQTFSELDDDKYSPPTLDREELFKEEKLREENRYLLQELKSVLATKDEKAMVGIPRALLSKKFDDHESKSTVNDQTVDLCEGITVTDVKLLNNPICINGAEYHKDQSEYDSPETEASVGEYNNGCNHSYQQRMSVETDDDLEIDAEIERSNVVNPFASMIAAAALARNKEFGLNEQRYEIDGETETFGDVIE